MKCNENRDILENLLKMYANDLTLLVMFYKDVKLIQN